MQAIAHPNWTLPQESALIENTIEKKMVRARQSTRARQRGTPAHTLAFPGCALGGQIVIKTTPRVSELSSATIAFVTIARIMSSSPHRMESGRPEYPLQAQALARR